MRGRATRGERGEQVEHPARRAGLMVRDVWVCVFSPPVVEAMHAKYTIDRSFYARLHEFRARSPRLYHIMYD